MNLWQYITRREVQPDVNHDLMRLYDKHRAGKRSLGTELVTPMSPVIEQTPGAHFEIIPDHSITMRGYTLYRIRAVKDFEDVKAGEVGGYVQKPENIDPHSFAWVYGNGKALEGARLSGHARLYGNAQAYGSSYIGGFAEVYGTAQILGRARIYENAHLCGNAIMRGNTQAYGRTVIDGETIMDDSAQIYGGDPFRPLFMGPKDPSRLLEH